MHESISRNENMKPTTNSSIQVTFGNTISPNKEDYEPIGDRTKYRARFKTMSSDLTNLKTVNVKSLLNRPLKGLDELKNTNLNIIKKKANLTKYLSEGTKDVQGDSDTIKSNTQVKNQSFLNICGSPIFNKVATPVNKKLLMERRRDYLGNITYPKLKCIIKKDNLMENMFSKEDQVTTRYSSDKANFLSQISKEIFDKEYTQYPTNNGIGLIKHTLNVENKTVSNFIKIVSTTQDFFKSKKEVKKLVFPSIKGRVSLQEICKKPENFLANKTTKIYSNTGSNQFNKTKSNNYLMNKTSGKNYLSNTESRILSTIDFIHQGHSKKKIEKLETCFRDDRPFFAKRSLSQPMGEIIDQIQETQFKLGVINSHLGYTFNQDIVKYNEEWHV
jgi:hypothetical protein